MFGGRTWTAVSTAALLVPAIGLGLAVQDPATGYPTFLALALAAGIGGGNFASSMANISFFYPIERKGAALGWNAGLGNLGVGLAQLAVPLVVGAGLFGAIGGPAQTWTDGAATREIWLQNAGYVWVPLIVAAALAAWFGMDDLAPVRASFEDQAVIFMRKHNWILSWLYLGTFGSFIGFAAGFPLVAETEFGGATTIDLRVRRAARSARWPARPAAGSPIASAVRASRSRASARWRSSSPRCCWRIHAPGAGYEAFLVLFALLFIASGAGNGAVFQMIPAVFVADRRRAFAGQADARARALREGTIEGAASLGFASAIAAFGGFFIPKAYGTALAADRRHRRRARTRFSSSTLSCGRGDVVVLRAPRRRVCHADPAIRSSHRTSQEHRMSHFLDRLTYFTQDRETFSDGHGVMTTEDRSWEHAYRDRWAHDKIVRSTHGVNCTGSCSWKIYVKGGVVTWETQQTDYPRTRPDMPNHEPRGCSRGASYSWYIYSANRIKYPMVRGRLVRLWREARKTLGPVEAWASIVEDPVKAKSYKSVRGMGGFIRSQWDEVNEIIAAANVYTIKKHGPDRVIGFSPIPAMSMVSYAAGSRYLSLIGGVCMSFYDWYCDLPPSSPQTWGEQTDVPESADWYNSTFIMAWGSNVPQTRTPDAHFFTEVRYKGAKIVAVTPDYAEVSKLADLWLHPTQGTDAALAMAMGHVILKEFHLERPSAYFQDYCRRYSDMPMLVKLVKRGNRYVADRLLRASDFADSSGRRTTRNGRPVAVDESTGKVVAPQGTIGYRWGQKEGGDLGKWNLEDEGRRAGRRDEARAVADRRAGRRRGGRVPVLRRHRARELPPQRPGRRHPGAQRPGEEARARRRRGAGRDGVRPHVRELRHRPRPGRRQRRGVLRRRRAVYAGVAAEDHRRAGRPGDHDRAPVRRQRRQDARQVDGDHRRGDEPLVPLRHELPRHHQHADHVRLRRAVGRRLGALRRPGEAAAADRLDRARVRARLAPSAAADELDVVLLRAHRPVALREGRGQGDPVAARRPERVHGSLIDFNVRAERMGWLPSAPQLQTNPLQVVKDAAAAGADPKDYAVSMLKSGGLKMSCEDPDNPANFPRNLFVWRSNLLGSSGKGHEYFLKHLLGTNHGVQGKDLGSVRRAEARGSRLARRGARRQARPPRHARLPHVDDLHVLGHRAADGDLVREERPQHVRHAPVHPPAVGGDRPGVGSRRATGRSTRRSRRSSPRSASATSASRRTWCSRRRCTTRRPSSRRRSTSRTGRRASASSFRARPRRRSR